MACRNQPLTPILMKDKQFIERQLWQGIESYATATSQVLVLQAVHEAFNDKEALELKEHWELVAIERKEQLERYIRQALDIEPWPF